MVACSGGFRPTGSISLGLNILNMYPLPNNQSTTIGTNHQFIQPTFDTLLYQPAIKFDYQITQGLRASFKYQGNNIEQARNAIGSLPGWNDAITPIPNKGTEAVTVNYNINSTTFLEGHLRTRRKSAGWLRRDSRERRSRTRGRRGWRIFR